ncbi:class I SAM-dependent methyltransferase [Thermodesulfobacteriota bacterium]
MEFEATKYMSSKEFWKKTNRNKYRAKADTFSDSLIDPETGLVYEDLVYDRSCPLCETDDPGVVFIKKGFQYVQCNGCSMLYTNPALKEDKYQEMYEVSQHTDEFIDILKSESQRKYDENKYNYGLDIVEGLLDQGRVLDIGCSIGVFLELAQKRDWKAYGLELNRKAYEHTIQNNLRVENKLLSDSSFKSIKFDLLTIWDLLEHILAPKEFLSEIRSVLSDSGALLILTPNINSMAARIMHEKCNVFEGWAHVSLFSVETLHRILEETGFRIEHSETIISEINIINNFINYQHPYQGDLRDATALFSLITEEDILKNKLGYKILTVALKK